VGSVRTPPLLLHNPLGVDIHHRWSHLLHHLHHRLVLRRHRPHGRRQKYQDHETQNLHDQKIT